MGALIAILTFLVVVVVFLGIWVFASSEGNQEQIRKRMSSVHKAESRGDVSLNLKLVRDEMMSGVPWIHQLMLRWSWSSNLQDFVMRSEEHTSELQSRFGISYAVFCLKKKT